MNEVRLKEYFLLVRQGDKEAFAHIYNELKQPVFTIVCRIVQSKEIAEDITQDLFVKLFVSPPDSSIRNVRAWIFQMTRNLAIDALRKGQCMDIDDVDIAEVDKLDGFLVRWDIEAAMRRLPCVEREILSLHINGELTFLEISRIVELSLPATYRKYRKAIHTLRERLGGGAI